MEGGSHRGSKAPGGGAVKPLGAEGVRWGALHHGDKRADCADRHYDLDRKGYSPRGAIAPAGRRPPSRPRARAARRQRAGRATEPDIRDYFRLSAQPAKSRPSPSGAAGEIERVDVTAGRRRVI